MYLKQKSRSTGLSADVKLAKLSMIDLAGSERGTVAMAGGASRLREGANINKSLLALGESRKAFFFQGDVAYVPLWRWTLRTRGDGARPFTSAEVLGWFPS